jgi:hypothetical protein
LGRRKAEPEPEPEPGFVLDRIARDFGGIYEEENGKGGREEHIDAAAP